MEYMAKKIEKAKKHTVRLIGNQERRYEVQLPMDGFGSGNEVKTHEVKIGTEFYPTCECTCNMELERNYFLPFNSITNAYLLSCTETVCA